MTKKLTILPVDPTDVSRRPVEGVDLPEENDVEKIRKASEPLASRGGDTPDEAADATRRRTA